MALSGAIVLISLALAFYVHPYWYGLTAFIGADLIQASFTRFCPLAYMARKLGVRAGSAFS
jgi:hypothetical protein